MGNKPGSTYTYQTNSFNITVNSWYENSDGSLNYAQGEQFTLDKGSMGNINWRYTDSRNAVIVFQLSADDGFFYDPAGTYTIGGGLTN